MTQGSFPDDDFSHLPTVDVQHQQQPSVREIWKKNKRSSDSPEANAPPAGDEDISPDFLDDLIPHLSELLPVAAEPAPQLDVEALWSEFESEEGSPLTSETLEEAVFYGRPTAAKPSRDHAEEG